jgi:excinuclease ABC subunit A
LDEPTTGLHFDDVRKLLEVLHRLADLGNTVIIIEHNLDVIRNADWILDLGPEGGEDGGRVVAHGRPAKVAATPGSYTGQFLRRYYTSSNGHLAAADSAVDAPVVDADEEFATAPDEKTPQQRHPSAAKSTSVHSKNGTSSPRGPRKKKTGIP